jgi:hypothetical protein
MKKKLWCLILVALAMSLPAQGSEKKTVAVVEFDVRGQLNLKDAGKIVAEWLSASLLKTGRYELTERVLLGKVLAEQKLAVSGMIDEATAVAIGQIAGARILATGSITEWNGLISLTARFIDAETGQIISSADYKTKDSGSIPLKMDKVAQVLAGILPPTAFEEENRLAGIGVKPGVWPVSIVKVTNVEGKLRGIIDRGMDDYVTKGATYVIRVPEYGISEVTGTETRIGYKTIGTLKITYTEAAFSSGYLTLNPGMRDKTDLIMREGVAVRYFVGMGFEVGTYNAGAMGSFIYAFPGYEMIMAMGYTAPLLPLPSGFGTTVSVGFPVIGSFATDFNVKAGVVIDVSVALSSPSSPYEEEDITEKSFIGIGPYGEVRYKNFFLRGGVAAGTDDFITGEGEFLLKPLVSIGYRIMFF